MNENSIKYPTRPGRLVCFALPAMLAAIMLLAILPQRALAAGVVGDGTPGSCTDTALDSALVGGGSVTFYCGNAPITITVTDQMSITVNTTIDGGERVILDGNDATRLFYVNAGVALTLTNLTVSGGNGSSAPNNGYGGGIFNDDGSLSVINSTISDNHATMDGGGIYSTGGPLLVMNSTFYNNTTAFNKAGGGIEIVESTADVSNSTFSGNSATYGGGIDTYTDSGTLTLNVFNSTFSGNSAFDSGGGIRNNGGTITLKNTIVANNVSVVGNCTGAVIDGGGNLQYGSGGTDDSCGDTIPTGDPKLGSLADNGGPTWTMALLAGSAALDAADGSTCVSSPVNDLDQRGSPRSVDSQCDIGAFEYDAPQTGPVFTVNDIAGIDDGVCGIGNCRLREAINAANLHSGANTIELAASATYTLTMVDNFDPWYKGSGLPAIASDITINAHGATIARSQAGGTPLFRHFYIPGGGILRLNQATVRGGDATGRYGGGIFVHSGTLIVADSTISNNAAYSGGGIENNGVITMTRSTLSNNTAYWGGGIDSWGPAFVVNSTISGNGATYGGGIQTNSPMTVINSTIASNSAVDGGGIYIGSAFTLKNVIVANSGGENCYGTVIDGGGNLQYGGSTPDSCGATISTGDPQLGLLADNGGSTWTMALWYGSAAIDAADDDTCAAPPVNNLDQRRVTRPIGAHCDVGAYEAEFPYGVFLPLIRRE